MTVQFVVATAQTVKIVVLGIRNSSTSCKFDESIGTVIEQVTFLWSLGRKMNVSSALVGTGDQIYFCFSFTNKRLVGKPV